MLRSLLLAAQIAFGVLLALDSASAADLARAPLAPDHPLVGTWKLDLPSVGCYELYEILADGTTRVTSGEEAAESETELSAKPSSKGFYKWVDKIVRDNGKPDCMGATMELGHVATNYVLLHPSGTEFLLCEAEDIKTCFGPFVRQSGI